MLFQHIPLPEYRKCRHVIVNEPVCVPERNAGELNKKQRNLKSPDWKRTLLVTLPFAGALAFWQAYDGIILLILRDTFHLGDTLAGRVMALDNVCALFLLPLFGSLSDRCHSRLGRRTPLYYHWLPAGSFTDPVSGCCLSCWSVFPLRYLMWSIPVICRYFLLFQGSSFFVRFCLQYFFGKGRLWKGCMKKGNNLYRYRSYVSWWILCFSDTGLQPHDLCMGFYSRYWNGNRCYDHLSYDYGGGK